RDPEFWRKLNGNRVARHGTFNALIAEYKASPDWATHSKNTKRSYGRCLDQLQRAAGDRWQRESDLVRMRACDLAEDGIYLKIGKLRDKKHFVPLTAAQMAEIRSWGATDLEYLLRSPRGLKMSEGNLRQHWQRFRSSKSTK